MKGASKRRPTVKVRFRPYARKDFAASSKSQQSSNGCVGSGHSGG